MISYEVTSEKECLINGIGKLEAGEPLVVDAAQAEIFRMYNGYTLAKANFPATVKVTTVVGGGENNSTRDRR